ncbi:MAG: aspartate aminotransferase family protein [Chloroflexi bacterium]|nr:aspartate aminotransferase family protein [Chloroflexota bacterium]|tara:strand:+ start:1066 stop:2430 length:1365 start_codon:yes stop_codon:yes gene_type:complete
MTFSGQEIEKLQLQAGEHLFMHASQVNDWKGNLNIFVKGKGVWVEDIHGNKFLDSMGGLWYKAAGYGRKRIAEAVYNQMLDIESPPSMSASISQIELSSKIASLYHDNKARVFFVSGGAEAVETAIKMAKKFSILNGKPNAYKVISRRYSYHGGTAMAVSLGGALTADPMGPLMPGAIHVTNWNSYRLPFDGSPVDVAIKCANEFEEVIKHQGSDSIAAIIAEPVSAAYGIQIPPAEYWQRLREIADKYNIVLIADEVITGFGRLGEYFGPMNWDVKPDITTVAKALTSGYAPLGAAIVTKKISDAFVGGDKETFKHLITFGGHPIACAAGIENLKIFEEEDLVGNSKKLGFYLYEKLNDLKKHKIVGDVRGGLGLLAAVELVQDKKNKKVFSSDFNISKILPDLIYKNKIVTFRAGDIISICPPLSINKEEIDFLVSGLDESIKEISKILNHN